MLLARRARLRGWRYQCLTLLAALCAPRPLVGKLDWTLAGGSPAAVSSASDVCVAFLSYERPYFLVPSIRSFYAYVAAVEPELVFSIEILDNGSRNTTRKAILDGLGDGIVGKPGFRFTGIEQAALSVAFNKLFFELCTAPYILSLEEDWKARSEVWPAQFPVLQLSIAIMKAQADVHEVWLKDCTMGKGRRIHQPWKNMTANTDTRSIDFVMHRVKCMPGGYWGGYINGASLKDRSKHLQLGGLREAEKDGEMEYSQRACRHGFSPAYICLDPSCYDAPAGYYRGLFEHIGRRRVDRNADIRYF